MKKRKIKISKKNQEQIIVAMEYALVVILLVLFTLVYISRGRLI